MSDSNKTEIVYCPTTTTDKNIKLEIKQETKSNFNFSLFFAVFSVNLQAFAVGNSFGWSSAVLLDLESNDTERNPLGQSVTSFEESWIVSLVNLGAVVGTIFAGYGSKKFGKKKILLFFGVPVLVSHIMLMFANRVGQFYVARLLMGLGIGCTNTIVPLYVAEISETHIRGLLGCFIGVLYSLGFLSVIFIGAFVNFKTLSAFLVIPPALFLLFFGYHCPESPYYYLMNGDITSAKRSLKKLRNNDSTAFSKELSDIKEALQESNVDESLGEAFKARKFRKAIFITVVLMYYQQFVGIAVIILYMETILSAAGGSISSGTSTIIIAIVTLLSMIVSLFLIDRWGRKILLFISTLGCALSLIILGIFFYMENAGMVMTDLTWVPLFSLIVYNISFNFGLGPIPYTLNGELFSNKVKELASSFLCGINFSLGFIITLIFPILKDTLGLHGSFWFFAVNAITCMIFIFCYVPETKGKSFQEILKMLET